MNIREMIEVIQVCQENNPERFDSDDQSFMGYMQAKLDKTKGDGSGWTYTDKQVRRLVELIDSKVMGFERAEAW